MILYIIINILISLLIIIPLLLTIAFATLVERKIMASLQRRQGPNKVGKSGLLQPIADGLKLILKESVFPNLSNQFMFFVAPMISLILGLMSWYIIPFNENLIQVDIYLGVIYILAISSLSVYGVILAGWSSNSKYAFLGSIRSAAQMISYEVSIGLIIMIILLAVEQLNLIQIVISQRYIFFIIPFFPVFLMFFISILAETNRPPFDLPEAEAELVSGYNVEYAGVGFAAFFYCRV
jgi:NADH-quinone oxidoreductase subunit H